MASLLGALCTCMIIFMAATNASVEAARQFKVGDHLGWQEPGPNNAAFYSQWAAMNRFQVGDSLVFEYKNDSVLTVDKWDYYHCDSSDPITAFNNEKSIINLDKPGSFYFISGTDDHCKNGQRLIVGVISPHPISKSPPSISASPEAFSELAPSPSHSSGVSLPVVLSSVFMAFSAPFSSLLVVFSLC